MKKAYIQPELLIVKVNVSSMITTSALGLGDTPTDPNSFEVKPMVPGQYDFNSFEGIMGFITGQ